MEPVAMLVEAVRVIEEAEVPSDLRATAFGKAVDLLMAREGASLNRSEPVDFRVQNGDLARPESDLLGRVSQRIGVDYGIVADVYDQEDSELRVVVSPKRLDKAKMAATKQIALLVAAGRQAAGLEEATSFEMVRETAEDYGIYDQNNFARTLGDMGDDFIVSGSGRARTLKLRRPAWDKARDLIARWGGDSA